jgi:DNA-directed RNA polymerase specialized sigma subunit
MTTISLNIKQIDRQIDVHLRKISSRKLPSHLDRDDLWQSIYVAIIESLPKYNADLSSQNTFTNNVIRKSVGKQFLHLSRQKNQTHNSLDEFCAELEPSYNNTRSGELLCNEKFLFQMEVRNVIDAMQPEFQEICELLLHYTLIETTRRLRKPKNYVLRQMQSIRMIFAEAGIAPEFS